MSTDFSFDSGHVNAGPGFTIKRLEGCRVVTGHVPLSEFQILIHGFTDQAVMAQDLASKMGVTFVIGEPDDIERLRHCNLPVSPERIRDAEMAKEQNLPAGLVEWLLNGERGRSSDAMCQAMFGIPKNPPKTAHPLDPSDFLRCLKFLDAAGQKELWRMERLSGISKEWAALVDHWDELKTSFIAECGASFEGKSAPKTNDLIKSNIGN